MTNKRPVSQEVEHFLNFCEQAKRDYEHCYSVVEECNKRTTDFNHALELQRMNYAERARAATRQVRNLQERREAKDVVEVTEALHEFLLSEEWRRAAKKLREVLGSTRKTEAYHVRRMYRKRADEEQA